MHLHKRPMAANSPCRRLIFYLTLPAGLFELNPQLQCAAAWKSSDLLDGDILASGRRDEGQVVAIPTAVLGDQVVLVDAAIPAHSVSDGCPRQWV